MGSVSKPVLYHFTLGERSMFKKDNNLTSGKGEWDESKHPRDEDGKFISISEFRYLKTQSQGNHKRYTTV